MMGCWVVDYTHILPIDCIKRIVMKLSPSSSIGAVTVFFCSFHLSPAEFQRDSKLQFPNNRIRWWWSAQRSDERVLAPVPAPLAQQTTEILSIVSSRLLSPSFLFHPPTNQLLSVCVSVNPVGIQNKVIYNCYFLMPSNKFFFLFFFFYSGWRRPKVLRLWIHLRP